MCSAALELASRLRACRSLDEEPPIPLRLWEIDQCGDLSLLRLGVMAIILGFECLVIDSASLYSASGTNAESFLNPVGIPSANTREWRPKEWFPLGLPQCRRDHDSVRLHAPQAMVRIGRGLSLPMLGPPLPGSFGSESSLWTKAAVTPMAGVGVCARHSESSSMPDRRFARFGLLSNSRTAPLRGRICCLRGLGRPSPARFPTNHRATSPSAMLQALSSACRWQSDLTRESDVPNLLH